MLLPLITLLAAAPVDVAVLSTQPTGTTTELRFVRLGAGEPTTSVAKLTHVESGTVLGTLLPKTHIVLAVAQPGPSRSPMWASSLYRLEPGRNAVLLTDRVALATRAQLSPDGRVFVQRGRAGIDGVDAITIDEVNPKTSATRSIHSFTGFFAFIAGAFEGELLLYRSGPERADLVAVHRDSMGVRPLISDLPAFAHDFAVDAPNHALYFTQGDPATHRWHLERIDLKSLERATLLEGPEPTLLPTVLPNAKLVFCPGAGLGLRAAGADAPLISARGPGFERVRFVTRDGIAIGLHEIPSQLPLAFAYDLSKAASVALPVPSAMRLDIAGIIER